MQLENLAFVLFNPPRLLSLPLALCGDICDMSGICQEKTSPIAIFLESRDFLETRSLKAGLYILFSGVVSFDVGFFFLSQKKRDFLVVRVISSPLSRY